MRSNERSVAAYTICGWLWRVKARKGACWGQKKGGEKKKKKKKKDEYGAEKQRHG
jgi:hypothetical protein